MLKEFSHYFSHNGDHGRASSKHYSLDLVFRHTGFLLHSANRFKDLVQNWLADFFKLFASVPINLEIRIVYGKIGIV